MRRALTLTATLAATLALPTLAQASTGTVLSLASHHHQLQLVSSNKSVHAFSFSGSMAGVKRGTRLSYTAAGAHITHARAVGMASSFSFLGTVVRSNGGGLLLALSDSQRLRLSSRQLGRSHARKGSRHAHASGGTNITVNINGLQPGETVEVTESTDGSGNVTITITLPSGSSSELTANGLVNNVNTDTFDISAADGSDLNFHMAAAALAAAGMSSCDAVVVSYHVDDQMLIADNVVDNGPSNDGSCSDGSGGSDWIGTITAVSGTSISVDAGADNGGVQTFAVNDPSVTAGYLVGDSVDVSYEQNGGQLLADSICYSDTSTSGVVTALASAGGDFETVTMTDDSSGQSETFFVPSELLDGQGVQIGDDLSVSFYQAARGLTLDYLEDDGSGN